MRRSGLPPVMAVLGLLAGCGAVTGPDSASRPTPAVSPTPTTSADLTRTPAPSQTSSQTSSQPPTQSPAPRKATGPEPSGGKPRDALLTIPRIRVFELPVVAYEGWTDDGPGTEIQNRGVAASPHGPRGGTGPGGVGNYQVTAHRLSSTQAFLRLPELENGDRVIVDAAEVRYVYQIVETRETSFRSEESLRAQRAAVPGRPGVAPTEAMITLSTCATPEDHAAGNYWADEFDNPEHRIDKIGVLVETR